MIYILHGDNLVKTRVLIVNHQKKFGVESKTELDISKITPQDLLNSISTNDLFGNPPFVILDISGLGRSNPEPFIEILKKSNPKSSIIIFSNKTLSPSSSFIKNSQTLNAKVVLSESIPRGNIFKFIDALYDKNRLQTYKELIRVSREESDSFYIFSMILYGLRNIAGSMFETSSYKKTVPFVKTKSKNQANNFTKTQIVEFFEYFYNLDKKSKLGEITPDIAVTMAVEKVLNS